ncbi:MAG: lamin tail domain-containing protein [Chloroflexi bacterium]|nr:lamin tail domain-containing protein [Chloroflexota bacterium]
MDPSPTAIPLPTIAPTQAAPLSVLINEVAWSGTIAHASDEWIELHNPGSEPIDLHGWQLTDDSDLHVLLNGVLLPYRFYLLERTTDQTVADVTADQIYTGGLNNSGESLWLLDPTGMVVDSANAAGGAWPAGNEAARRSMERRGGDDRSGNWGVFPGFGGVGRDSLGNAIGGTPRQPNAVDLPKPTATGVPSRLVINEVLIRPHYDWEGTGGVSPDDEFIELYNAGDLPVHLLGWVLDDIDAAGSKPYVLPDTVLQAHDFLAFFRTRTNVALNDTGDTVRLIEPGGRVVDQISYLKVRASNLSYGRLPDGGHHLRYGLCPTSCSLSLSSRCQYWMTSPARPVTCIHCFPDSPTTPWRGSMPPLHCLSVHDNRLIPQGGRSPDLRGSLLVGRDPSGLFA